MKHIFSKQELDTLTPNARIAVLSGYFFYEDNNLYRVNGDKTFTAIYGGSINHCFACADSDEELPDYYGSLDSAWSLVPDDSDDFNWVNIRRDSRNRFVCDAEYAVGEPKDTLAEAIIDMMENYWQKEYRDYVGTFSSETATLDYAVPDFETWIQTREDSE